MARLKDKFQFGYVISVEFIGDSYLVIICIFILSRIVLDLYQIAYMVFFS